MGWPIGDVLRTFRLAPGALPHSGMRLGDVPAVSMALRRVDRLRAANIAGVPWKFARKLARPPSGFHRGWAEKRGVYTPLDFFGFGRAGGYGWSIVQRRRSQATAGSARTRQGTLGSLDSPFAAASSDEGRCEPERRRKPRPPRHSAVASNKPCIRNAPQQSSRHHGGVDCVPYCASATAS